MSSFPYSFIPRRPLPEEFARVLGCIEARLKFLQSRSGDENVHEVRKLIKLARALLWFAQPALESRALSADKGLREAGQTLSAQRDAAVIHATLTAIAQKSSTSRKIAAFELVSDATKTSSAGQQSKLLRQAILAARKTLHEVVLDLSGEWESPQRRIKRGLERLEEARQTALDEGSPEQFHDWRKKAKRLMLLLQVLKPGKARLIHRLDKIQDQLGKYHDAFMLREKLEKDWPHPDRSKELRPMLKMMNKRQRRLIHKTRRTSRKVPRE